MDNVLLTTAEAVPPQHAAAVLQTAYGLSGELTDLPGESDHNFLLNAKNGNRYVVKFAHPLTDPEVIATQARTLKHLENTTTMPVQHVIPTRDNELTAQDQGRVVLVTTYLPGTPMRATPMTTDMRRHLGETLAELAQKLKPIQSSPRELLWDIAQLPALRPLAAELPARLGSTQLTALIDRFQQETEPRLRQLRTQLVHNDFNLDNILIDAEKITGILDFGDMTNTALANDIAVAACYQLDDGPDLIQPAIDLIVGYHQTTPLTAEERDLLPGLILARMTARVIIPRWRALRFPGNEEYILRSTAMASRHLDRLLAIPSDTFAERILEQTRA
jgi:hydroxylysine kinase